MPTLIAATQSRSTAVGLTPGILASASASATKPPVMAAVRVPPSAWMTSQSIHTVRSPSLPRSATARSARPTSRWISCERPLGPRFSRFMRVLVERGSMPYSAVTQPSPCPLRNGGTLSSTVAVQITLVAPNSTSTEPSGCTRKSRASAMGRSWSGARPSARGTSAPPFRSAGAGVPGALVVAEAAHDGARDLVAVARLLEALLLPGIGHEADLHQDGRHGGAAEDVEAGLLDAAVGDAQRLGHGVEHGLGQPRGLGLELRLGQVPQDRLHDVGAAGAAAVG